MSPRASDQQVQVHHRRASRPSKWIPAGIRGCTYSDDETWVYAYRDRDDRLLYVGIAVDAERRAGDHRRSSKWWRFVATAEAWLESDINAALTEQELIRDLCPLFNLAYAVGDEIPTLEYCAYREAWDQVDDLIEILRRGDDPVARAIQEVLGPTELQLRAARFTAEYEDRCRQTAARMNRPPD